RQAARSRAGGGLCPRAASRYKRTRTSRQARSGVSAQSIQTIVEVNRAAAETAFLQQLELLMEIAGKRPFAASHHDGRQEQVALVDQPGLDRLGGEVRTAHADVTSRRRFHAPDSLGVEV